MSTSPGAPATRVARPVFTPSGDVILSGETARLLGRALLAANNELGRRGGRLAAPVRSLAVAIGSAPGTTEYDDEGPDDTVVHEQIDVFTAAEIIGCSPRNVRALAQRGRLPATKLTGRWVFHRDDVLEWCGDRA